MNEQVERGSVTFPSRFGYWSLDERALRTDTGTLPLLRQVYSHSKPMFALILLMVVYTPLGLVVDSGVFNLELSIVFLLTGAFLLLLLFAIRIVHYLRGISYRDTIATEDIVGVAFREFAGATNLFIVFTDNDDMKQRIITTPISWWADVDTELDRIKAALRRHDIPIDETGDDEVHFGP